MTGRLFAALVLAAHLAGCASGPGRAGARTSAADLGQAHFVRTELYFGISRPDGLVSAEEWDWFLGEYVAPRFKDGLTVVDAKDLSAGSLIREDSRLLILLHEDAPAANGAIEEIRSAYRRLFAQESVLRVTSSAEVSFTDVGRVPEAAQIAVLENQAIYESSGMAASRSQPGVFWTHNDSDDAPRFFAFDLKGRHLGEFWIQGGNNKDWEDMCSGTLGGTNYVLLCDAGDNLHARNTSEIYVVVEPLVPTGTPPGRVDVPFARMIEFSFEDGPHDCEAIGLDEEAGLIYLVGKEWGWSCSVYVLDVSDAAADGVCRIARKAATLKLPRVVGMDFSPDGLRAIVLTYGDAYEFKRWAGEDWAHAFHRRPVAIPLPKRSQGESVCYSLDGTRLYLTSENLPTPLWEVAIPVE